MTEKDYSIDSLSEEISVLTRRELEARILIPVINALGAADLGQVFSCNRGFALIEGFNPGAVLTRKQTLMQGGPVCDFRYDFSVKDEFERNK